MRSIETLVSDYPEKTGAEILKIQEDEKLEDQRQFDLRNAKQLQLIDDINKNGGFYKGTFGLNQHFLYNFTDLEMDEKGNIYCEVESIVIFSRDDKRTPLNVQIQFDTYKDFSKYGVNMYERVTQEDYNEVINYFKNSVNKFW